MGVFTRHDSPYYWLELNGFRSKDGKRALREPTKIPHHAATVRQRQENRAAAERRYHDRMSALNKGVDDDAPDEDTAPPPTFAVIAAWFEKHQLPRRRGREREAALLPKLVAVFGDYPITAITRSLVTERWITPRLTTPTVIARAKRTAARTIQAGPRTVNREVAVIKAVVQAAVPEHLAESPLRGMPLLKTTSPKRRLMTADEERRLLAVMAPDDKALFLLGLDSLVRLSDLLDLKRVDDHKTTMYIADPKAGGGFEVPISRRARTALNAWYQHRTYPKISEYIFSRRRVAKTERDRRGAIRQMLERYCAEADVPYGRTKGGITFHWATRRTGLTRMLTNKVDLGTAQKIGRWKRPDVVLGVYHELIDEVAHRAVNTVGRRR